MTDAVTLRPLGEPDIEEMLDVCDDAFGHLHQVPGQPLEPMTARARADSTDWFRHAFRFDPGAAWGAADPVDPDRLLGVVLGLRRGALWFLSLLAVRADAQVSGLGARLIAAAETTAEGAGAGMVCASQDPRALRRYWRSGFAIESSWTARGKVDRAALPVVEGIRDGDLGRDLDLVEALDLAQRGSTRAPDVAMTVTAGGGFLVAEAGASRGYVVHRRGRVWGLAASDVPTAARLLTAALAEADPAPGAEDATVGQLIARMPWAVDVVLRAGLRLEGDGGVGFRGATGPMTSYIINGAFG